MLSKSFLKLSRQQPHRPILSQFIPQQLSSTIIPISTPTTLQNHPQRHLSTTISKSTYNGQSLFHTPPTQLINASKQSQSTSTNQIRSVFHTHSIISSPYSSRSYFTCKSSLIQPTSSNYHKPTLNNSKIYFSTKSTSKSTSKLSATSTSIPPNLQFKHSLIYSRQIISTLRSTLSTLQKSHLALPSRSQYRLFTTYTPADYIPPPTTTSTAIPVQPKKRYILRKIFLTIIITLIVPPIIIKNLFPPSKINLCTTLLEHFQVDGKLPIPNDVDDLDHRHCNDNVNKLKKKFYTQQRFLRDRIDQINELYIPTYTLLHSALRRLHAYQRTVRNLPQYHDDSINTQIEYIESQLQDLNTRSNKLIEVQIELLAVLLSNKVSTAADLNKKCDYFLQLVIEITSLHNACITLLDELETQYNDTFYIYQQGTVDLYPFERPLKSNLVTKTINNLGLDEEHIETLIAAIDLDGNTSSSLQQYHTNDLQRVLRENEYKKQQKVKQIGNTVENATNSFIQQLKSMFNFF